LFAVPASSWQLDNDIAFAAVVAFVQIALVAFAASAFVFRGTEAFADSMVGLGPAAETTCGCTLPNHCYQYSAFDLERPWLTADPFF
jgi:hypothetical protein